jgi:hypothetical protein
MNCFACEYADCINEEISSEEVVASKSRDDYAYKNMPASLHTRWQRENKDKVNAYSRKSYAKNKEKHNQKNNNYYKNNREALLAKRKQKYKDSKLVAIES